MLYIVGLLLGGVALANQSPINARLGAALKSPFRSSLVSFTVGFVFLVAVFLVSGQHVTLTGQHPWWIWTPGIFGVVYLTSNILLFPKIGAIQAIVFPIVGQVLMGLMIDTFGWFAAKQLPMTLTKAGGAALLLFGVYVAVVWANRRELNRENAIDKSEESALELNAWRIWGVITGAVSSAQQAIAGKLAVALGSAIGAAIVSFGVGMLIIFLVVLLRDKRLMPSQPVPSQPKWVYIGGILGSIFVVAMAVSVPVLGAGFAVMIGLIGALAGSMAVSHFGWWQSPRQAVSWLKVIGIIVMAVGVAFIKLG